MGIGEKASSDRFQWVATFPLGCDLGESPLWHDADACLWLTDIPNRVLLKLDPATGDVERYDTPERVGCFAFIHGDDRRLIVAFESGIAIFEPQTGVTQWLWRPEPVDGPRRFNDGRVDSNGRFWTGTMVADPEGAEPNSAYIVCIGPDGQPLRRIEGLGVANGLCTTPDGRRLHFADSRRKGLFTLDLDHADSVPTPFATVSSGYPDGAVTTEDGTLWTAIWGGGCVQCYGPGGSLQSEYPVPALQPTSVAFGGPNRSTLFVTTAKRGLSPDALASQPLAGAVFMFDTSAKGLVGTRYRSNGTRHT